MAPAVLAIEAHKSGWWLFSRILVGLFSFFSPLGVSSRRELIRSSWNVLTICVHRTLNSITCYQTTFPFEPHTSKGARSSSPTLQQLHICRTMISRLTTLLLGLALLLTPLLAAAQFGQFFEQMFHGGGGGQRSQQQERNVPSDSEWYRRNYDDGGYPFSLSLIL